MEKYKVKVECDNCGFIGEVKIPKRTPVTESDCPTCGCKMLFPSGIEERSSLEDSESKD